MKWQNKSNIISQIKDLLKPQSEDKPPIFLLHLVSQIQDENNRFFFSQMVKQIMEKKRYCVVIFQDHSIYSLLNPFEELDEFLEYDRFLALVNLNHMLSLLPSLLDKTDLQKRKNLEFVENAIIGECFSLFSNAPQSRVIKI